MPISRTAQYVALYRALETDEMRREPLFRDPFARRFLSRPLKLAVRLAKISILRRRLERYAERRAPGARTSAIGRTRFIDDVIRREVLESGTKQLVTLGAGFDCRAHRLAELAMPAVNVFEVDRSSTQEEKRRRLSTGSARLVRYVSVDFLQDDVESAIQRALEGVGWDRSRPTIFLWEGVTNYLTEKAVHSMLAWIGTAAPGSIVIFTYIHAGLFDGTEKFDGAERMLANVRALGEPWQFGIHPNAIEKLLAQWKLTLRDDLGANEYRARYSLDDSTPGYAFYRLAVAAVAN